ncbi:MAG: ArsR family transcriptional regulator [Bacteroidetes bacterium]|nr:ArsR family transcriptional regulator [Bacteroidota bacterium]
MLSQELKEEKERLVELLGVYFENDKQTPPLAGRIKATLVINGEGGTTFEQLVKDLGAGKSTVSTHLNSLIAQGDVYYFTKSGDRKRYFAMTPGYISRKIQSFICVWKNEIQLHNQILEFKTKFNKAFPDERKSLKKHEQSVKFLTDSIVFFEKENTKYTE